jgi:hypothetical protein
VYVIPEDTFHIFPVAVVSGRTHLTVYSNQHPAPQARPVRQLPRQLGASARRRCEVSIGCRRYIFLEDRHFSANRRRRNHATPSSSEPKARAPVIPGLRGTAMIW